MNSVCFLFGFSLWKLPGLSRLAIEPPPPIGTRTLRCTATSIPNWPGCVQNWALNRTSTFERGVRELSTSRPALGRASGSKRHNGYDDADDANRPGRNSTNPPPGTSTVPNLTDCLDALFGRPRILRFPNASHHGYLRRSRSDVPRAAPVWPCPLCLRSGISLGLDCRSGLDPIWNLRRLGTSPRSTPALVCFRCATTPLHAFGIRSHATRYNE